MPTFARLVFVVLLLSIGRLAWSQSGDRYSDWHSGDSAHADGEVVGQPPPIEQPVWHEPAGNEAPDEPSNAPRQLPFKFAQSATDTDRSKVIRAAATEAAPQPLTKPKDGRPIALKPKHTTSEGKRNPVGLQSGATIAGSLAVVVGLFLIVAWMARRGMPKQPPLLPREAVEVLGRQRFGGKQQEVQLVRVGNKLVLVHIVQGHVEPLTEITDPAEVDRLTGLCYQTHPHSSSRRFQQTFEQLAKDKSSSSRSSRDPSDKFDLSIFDDIARRTAKAT